MIKKIIIISFLISTFFHGQSQAPTWQWIKGGFNGGSGPDFAMTDMGTDNEGNIYGICKYKGSLQLDTLQWMMGYGGEDFCVVSYTCEGQFRWVKRFGGQYDDSQAGLTVMKNGDCIITGNVIMSIWGDAYFADSMLTANNSIGRGVFICKLNNMGDIVYLKFPSKDWDLASTRFLKQELGSAGMIHILSTFSDSTTWGNFHIPAKGNYVLKFNPNNGFMTGFAKLDFRVLLNPISGKDFKVDIDSIFIGNDTVIIDSTTSYVSTLAKFDTKGNNIWHKDFSWNKSIPYDSVMFGLNFYFAMDDKKLYIGGSKRSYSGTYFMGFPINNPIASHPYNITPFIAAFEKDSGNIVNFINLWTEKYNTLRYQCRKVKNGKLYDGNIGGGLVLMNNGADTIKPFFTPNSQHSHGYFPFIYEIDTGLTHFNWGIALKSYGSISFDPASMLIDHNDNIILGTKIGGGLMLPQDTILKHYDGAYFIKVAQTNDSCDCEASVPTISVIGSVGNTLTVKASATNTPDSLYIIWGDGDSTLYSNPGTNINHTFSNSGPWNVCLRAYAFCGDVDTCLTGLYSGLEKAEDKNSFFSIYPNPAKDKINIVFNEIPTADFEIQLLDVMGKLIKNQFVIRQKQSILDISNLNNGVYIIKINSKDAWSKSIKIIKN